jgi:hypothetical protein
LLITERVGTTAPGGKTNVKETRDSDEEKTALPLFPSGGYATVKRRGNPNWGKLDSGPAVPTVTEFEKAADEHKLTPEQYLQSSELREWARRNKNSKYIPEPLLEGGSRLRHRTIKSVLQEDK